MEAHPSPSQFLPNYYHFNGLLTTYQLPYSFSTINRVFGSPSLHISLSLSTFTLKYLLLLTTTTVPYHPLPTYYLPYPSSTSFDALSAILQLNHFLPPNPQPFAISLLDLIATRPTPKDPKR